LRWAWEESSGSTGPVLRTPDARRGAEIYQTRGCRACRTLDGAPSVGPTFKGIWNTQVELDDGRVAFVDDAYVTESLRDPGAKVVKGFPAVMPVYSGLNDQEVAAIVALISALGEDRR